MTRTTLPSLLVAEDPDKVPSSSAQSSSARSRIEVVASTLRRPPILGSDRGRQDVPAVHRGRRVEELAATTPQDVAVVRRLQGALTALEAVAGGPVRESKPAK